MVVLDGGAQLGVGRLDVAADAAPEVEFPRGVEAGGPHVERGRRREAAGRPARRAAGGRKAEQAAVLADLGVGVGAEGLLRLRQEVAGRDVALGAGLEDARRRRLQVEVLLAGGLDQGIQGGIAEDAPPGVGGRRGHDARVGVDPVRGDGGRRLVVVRPDLEAVAHVLGEGRAAAGRQQQQREDGQSRQRPGEARTISTGSRGMAHTGPWFKDGGPAPS